MASLVGVAGRGDQLQRRVLLARAPDPDDVDAELLARQDRDRDPDLLERRVSQHLVGERGHRLASAQVRLATPARACDRRCRG